MNKSKYDIDLIKYWDSKLNERPFYLLDLEKLKSNYKKLDDAFKEIYNNFQIAYSYKTNYIPAICKTIDEIGGYAEVVSDMELYLAYKIGVNPKNIIYNGPYKGKGEFDLIEKGGTVVVDNFRQLQEIIDYVLNFKDKQYYIALRINYELIEGKFSRFGFDINNDDLKRAIDLIENVVNLNVKGIQCHFSGARSKTAWKTRIVTMLDVAQKYFDNNLEFIDLGSGMFGEMAEELSCQFADQPTFMEYANTVATEIKDKYKNSTNKPKLIVEPGTTLVANTMKMVTKVTSIKDVRGKKFIGLNASMHNLGELSTKKNLPIEIVKSTSGTNYISGDLVGYTCLEYDVMYREFKGDININDYIVFDNVGSYSVVLKPPFILPHCAIIESKNNEITKNLLKKNETYENVFKDYVF